MRWWVSRIETLPRRRPLASCRSKALPTTSTGGLPINMKPAISDAAITPPGPRLPDFDALAVHEGTGLRAAWGVLDSDLGTVGLLTPDGVARAAQDVRTGDVFPL